MVSRSLRTRRAISASSTHKMTGRIESGGKDLIWLHPLDETTILHAARELSRSAEYSYIPIGPSRAKPGDPLARGCGTSGFLAPKPPHAATSLRLPRA